MSPEPRHTAEPPANFARSFAAEPDKAGSLALQLGFDRPVGEPRVEQLADGRIVIDLAAARSALGRYAERIAHPLARQVRFGQHDDPTRLRIVVDAVPGATVQIAREAAQLTILLAPPSGGASPVTPLPLSDAAREAITPPTPPRQLALAPHGTASASPSAGSDGAAPESVAAAARPAATMAASLATPAPVTPLPGSAATPTASAPVPTPSKRASATPGTSAAAAAPSPTATAATISLHFVGADAASVVRLVAEAGGLSVRLPPGRVPPLTVALRDVTPRVALERIGLVLGWALRSQGDELVFDPAGPAPRRSLEPASEP